MNDIELFVKFKENSDNIELRNKIVLNNLDIVEYLANSVYNAMDHRYEYSELFNMGVIGLIDSIYKFDTSKNLQFSTYASIRIKGAIYDGIRTLDNLPKSLRTKAKLITTTTDKLEVLFGRQPTLDELSEETGLSVKSIQVIKDALKYSYAVSVSKEATDELDTSVDYDIEDINTETPEIMYIKNVYVPELIKESLSKLSKSEHDIIMLYYYSNLTLKKISEIKNVSESRVCQIHKRALRKLRQIMLVDKDILEIFN